MRFNQFKIMKTVAKTSRRVPGERRWALLLTVACALGAALPLLHGQATVSTIAGGAYPAEPYTGLWDGTIAPNNTVRFNNPRGMAIMASGNLLVADRDNDAIRLVNFSAGTVSTWLNLPNFKPVAVQVDSSGTIYVLSTNGICSYDTNRNLLATNVLGGAVTGASAMTMDGSGNFYVAIPPATVKIFSSMGITNKTVTGFLGLSGIALMKNGLVAVTETNQIRIFNPADAVPAPVVLVGSSIAGSGVGSAAFARFNSPAGLAVAPNGNLIVADRDNHQVRMVETNGYVSILYGAWQTNWPATQGNWGPGGTSAFPGWADGIYNPLALTAVYPAGREPANVLVAPNGDVFVTETYYHVLRKVTGTSLLTGGGGTGGGGTGSTNGVVDAPTFTPNWGYYPNGQTIVVNSIYTNIIYTTDGTDPSTNNGKHVVMNANVGLIRWQDGIKDLRTLKLRAYNGTNASDVAVGSAPPFNQIGISSSINTNYSCAADSKIYVPVVLNLAAGQVLKTFSYRIKVAQFNGAPAGWTFKVLPSTANDFVKVNGAGITNLNPIVGSNGVVSALGVNLPVLSGPTVLHLLELSLPANAVAPQSYSISITNVTGTSDGGDNTIVIQPGPPVIINVASPRFVVGDAAPRGWYNAGEFGDENINNSDVNNVYYAALGLNVPPPLSDAFCAMDADPVDSVLFGLGGNNQINYLDWQVVLLRAVREDTSKIYRVRTNGTYQISSFESLPDTAGDTTPLLPGSIWSKDVQVLLGVVGEAVPGSVVQVPVSLKIASGKQLSGLMFTVQVIPANGSGPALQVAPLFEPAPGIRPALDISNVGRAGEALGDRVYAVWEDAVSPYTPWTGSTLLGNVKFTIPPGAQAGQVYKLRFVVASGSAPGPVGSRAKTILFESIPGAVYVLANPPAVRDTISDDWRSHFFGATGLLGSGWNEDPDGDGVPNWIEYLAGTDPTSVNSKLRMGSSLPPGIQKRLVLRWLSAPQKEYILEASTNLTGSAWVPVSTNLGTGDFLELNETNLQQNTRYYRVRLAPQ
jgi:hypothetical protein